MEKYESGDTLCCVDFTRDQENQTDKLNLIHIGHLGVDEQFVANTVIS